MFKHTRLSGAILTIAAALALSACGSTTLSEVTDGHAEEPVWPAPEKARPLVESTVFPDLKVFPQIAPGVGKLEVYRLLGHPMYREGMAGVHEWDYLFKLPSGEPDKYVECQYKLLFDDEMHLRETYWNPAHCVDLAGGKPAPIEPKEPHVPATAEVSADTLFEFDSARLSADAPAAIDQQILRVLNQATRVETLRLIGYTDRMGGDAYNLDLSQRRAQAVKAYLVSNGVPAEAIQTEGRGSADPVVQCNDRQRMALIACLKPNRRVRIEVVAR